MELLKETFSDVFSGYMQNVPIYDISKSGTFFRFPLRNCEAAKCSNIAKEPVDIGKIDKLFDKFKEELSETLLFLNSVEEISLVEVTGDSQETYTKQVYTVNLVLSDDAREKRNDFQNYVKKMAGKLQRLEIGLADIKLKEVCYEVVIKDSEGNEMTWQIVQRFGFENPGTLHKSVTQAFDNEELGLLPRGGVAQLKSFKNGKNPSSKHCRLFCFLPMPVPLDLPVHINGHFALSHESRRGLWTDENGSFRMQWNKSVMEDIIAPAYCTLICTFRDNIKNITSSEEYRKQLVKYFDLFPKVCETTVPYINDMAKTVYKYIDGKNLKVLPLQSKSWKTAEWVSPNGETNHKIYFENLKTQIHEPTIPSSTYRGTFSLNVAVTAEPQIPKWRIVLQTLVKCGLSLFSCPFQLHHYFKESGVTVNIISPDAVIEFFATYNTKFTRCKIHELPTDIEQTKYKTLKCLVTLLEYCIKANNYKDKLEGLPFLVTTDNMVRLFDSSSLKFASNYSHIMPQALDRFILPEITSVLSLNCEKDNKLCKQFTISEFAKMLPDLLPADEFSGSECALIMNLKHHLQYQEGPEWLRGVWKFISSCVPAQHPNMETAILEMIKPLNNWYLLPVLCNKEERLYPVHKASSVLLLQTVSAIFQKYATMLTKLGAVQPNLSIMFSNQPSDSQVLQIAEKIFGNFEKPVSVLLALKDIITHLPVDNVNKAECLDLLSYFSKNIDQWKTHPEASIILKQLPFYVTIYDKVVSLQSNSIYVLPSKIPQAGMENWTRSQELIFLKEQNDILELLKFLGCQHLSIVSVYCDFVFQHFGILSFQEKISHMIFIKNQFQKMKIEKIGGQNVELERLKMNLQRLEFVPEKDGNTYFTASHFFDPREKVFKIMLDERKFPPEPYHNNELGWLDFLCDIGMISKVSQEQFVKFAKLVEKSASNDASNAAKKSEVLLKDFFNRADLDDQFCSQVKGIAFVSPGYVAKYLCALHPQFGVEIQRTSCTLSLSKVHPLKVTQVWYGLYNPYFQQYLDPV